VYVADSPSADEALVRARELARVGNFDGAARVVQGVLDESSGALVPDPEIEGVFISARTRAHRVLTTEGALLDRYRALVTPGAQALLDVGEASAVERAHLLTTPGYEAVLQLAQAHFEEGAFWSAWLVMRQLSDHPDHEGERATRASELLAQIAPFLAGDPNGAGAFAPVRETLEAWGVGDVAPLEWPAGARVRDPMQEGPALSTESLLDRPLASSGLGPGVGGEDQRAVLDGALLSWPTIVGPMCW
jgi:hypothetical protein